MSATMLFEGLAHGMLGHGLGGYGLHRILATQADPDARLYWSSAGPLLLTRFDPAELLEWLLEDYRPTPVVSPWNAGSGFGLGWDPAGRQKTSTRSCAALDVLVRAGHRFDGWAAAVEAARRLVVTARERRWSKSDMITACRNELPDEALVWVDAAVAVLRDEDGEATVAVNPLLGTGGNIGSADLAANHAQHLLAALGLGDAPPDRELRQQWLMAALAGPSLQQASPPLLEATSAHLFTRGHQLNPWSWVLAIEGACALAGSEIARARAHRTVFPTAAHPSEAGVGAHIAGLRGESWLPVWQAPMTWPELETTLAAGELWRWPPNPDARRPARTGLDVARAISGGTLHPALAGAARYVHVHTGTVIDCRYVGTVTTSQQLPPDPRNTLGAVAAAVDEAAAAAAVHDWLTDLGIAQDGWLTVAAVARLRGVAETTIRANLAPTSRSTMPRPDLHRDGALLWRLNWPILRWCAAGDRSPLGGGDTSDPSTR